MICPAYLRSEPVSNILYTKQFELAYKGDFDWEADTIRCLLERSTSSYTPDKDHDFLDSFTGGSGVEISVSSYARQTIASAAVNIDDANDRVELDMGDIDFGTLESGQTVRAMIFYKQFGGDDTTPENDPLIAYIDTATGLPAVLGGGTFSVTIDSEGFIQLSQP
jgi:hypothetical protein